MFGNKRGSGRPNNGYSRSKLSESRVSKIPKYDPATYSSSSDEYSDESRPTKSNTNSEINKLKQKNDNLMEKNQNISVKCDDLMEQNKNISTKCDDLHKTTTMLQNLLNNNNEIADIRLVLKDFGIRLTVLETKPAINNNSSISDTNSIISDKNLVPNTVDKNLVANTIDKNLVANTVDKNLITNTVDKNLVTNAVDNVKLPQIIAKK